MKFIELTQIDGSKVTVNVKRISLLEKCDGATYTSIGFSRNQYLIVKETVEEILKLTKI